jgi:L-amino acid N-acyltransferase YncA
MRVENVMLGSRVANVEDAAAITRIYTQGIEERIATFETEPRSVEQMASQLREKGDRYPTVVVERDGEVIAWAGFGAYRSRPCYAGVGEHSVYVAREARGAGLIALQALLAAAEERGFWTLLSRIFPENVASFALRRKAGFRELGVYKRHGKLDGEWRDCMIIEKLIGEASNG